MRDSKNRGRRVQRVPEESEAEGHLSGRESGIDYGQRLDALVEWLRENPATFGEILGTGAFASESSARRAIKRLLEDKRIKVIGKVETDGRPLDVFFAGSGQPKQDAIHHEVLLTRWLLHFTDPKVLRWRQVDKKLRPDATILL